MPKYERPTITPATCLDELLSSSRGRDTATIWRIVAWYNDVRARASRRARARARAAQARLWGSGN